MADSKNIRDHDERTKAHNMHMIAYHEAGHVVAAWRHGSRIKRATIVPEGDYLGQMVPARRPFAGIHLDYDRSPGPAPAPRTRSSAPGRPCG